jgi:hypothetical protein
VKIAGIDKTVLRDMLDIEVDDAVWQDFLSRKNAALLGVDLARDDEMKKRYVWEVGREFVLADMGGMSVHFSRDVHASRSDAALGHPGRRSLPPGGRRPARHGEPDPRPDPPP